MSEVAARLHGKGIVAREKVKAYEGAFHLLLAAAHVLHNDEGVEAMAFASDWYAGSDRRSYCFTEVRQHMCIQPVSLRQLPGGLGEVAHLAGIDDCNWQRCRGQSCYQGKFQTACGLRNHACRLEILKLCNQIIDAGSGANELIREINRRRISMDARPPSGESIAIKPLRSSPGGGRRRISMDARPPSGESIAIKPLRSSPGGGALRTQLGAQRQAGNWEWSRRLAWKIPGHCLHQNQLTADVA